MDDARPAEVPLDKDAFMGKLLQEIVGTLQNIVGAEHAAGFVAAVGSNMGRWVDRSYREALNVGSMSAEQVAQVFVELKSRIGGDFHIVDVSEDRIVIANRACPFGQAARGQETLCMMTSNVVGRLAADNLGYARVSLEDSIARGAPRCRIVVNLKPSKSADPDDREYYKVLEQV